MHKFIDLFSGIGGFKIGMEKAGYQCVFSAEIDKHACEMYQSNFDESPYNDVSTLDVSDIPDFDVLCAGFPCQTFSISGKQKGFHGDTRGTLFFDICRILEAKKPRAFILENVKNLETHDKRRTLTIMLDSLANLGYTVNFKVLNAKDFGVPQNRERVIIVGNREGKYFDFDKLEMNEITSMSAFLDEIGEFNFLNENEFTLLDKSLLKKQKSGLLFAGYKNKRIRTIGVRPGTEHLSRVHKQPNRIYHIDGVHPTIPSQETAGRFYITNGEYVRKLTIDECYRFMGFPEQFKKIGRSAQLYARIGNSVCTNVVYEVGKVLKNLLNEGMIEMSQKNPREILEGYYLELQDEKTISKFELNEIQFGWVKNIVEKEATSKAVYTVLLTSLFYKVLHPKQDVRKHQVKMEDGYSGRTFDTKYVTPFLKDKRFRGAMKESGWLTRSLEQDQPYNLDFSGAINNEKVKQSFLSIMNDIQENGEYPKSFLMNIVYLSMIEKEKENILIVNPVEREAKMNISKIMKLLDRHFAYKYNSRGASILPVVAFYSIYQSLVHEMGRYEGKVLEELASHYSSDRSSGASGDIVVKNEDGGLYEVIEVKYGIPIDAIMLEDAYKKIASTSIQRYYILSTIETDDELRVELEERIKEIKDIHGCQVIINGLMKTLGYYLRLVKDSDDFINHYVRDITNHNEINHEHQISWNNILEELSE